MQGKRRSHEGFLSVANAAIGDVFTFFERQDFYMGQNADGKNASLTLQVRPERKLIRKDGGDCAIDFHIQVGKN